MHANVRRLAGFFQEQRAYILADWEEADRGVAPAQGLPLEDLRNSMPVMLDELAEVAKNPPEKLQDLELPQAVPRAHARQRLELGFSLEDVVREYAILRKVIIKRLNSTFDTLEDAELQFVHEALDEIIVQATAAYSSAATHQLQEAEIRYRRLHDSGIIGVIEFSSDGTITEANEAFLEITGYSSADVSAGKLNAYDLTPQEYIEATEQALNLLLAHGTMFPHEKQYYRKDGSRADVLVSGAMVDVKAGHGFALVLDIGARKELDQDRDRKSEFEQQLIGIVSHDLRTPLNAISLAATLLQRRDDLDSRAHRVVGTISNSAERANRMIKDLLDFTRARLGGGVPIHRQRGDLQPMVAQLVEEICLAHPDRKIRLHQQGEAEGAWDLDRVAQIITNLVDNALNYGDKEAPVEVSLQGEQDQVVLEVCNQGPPIAPDVLPNLFEPLYQAEDAAMAPNRSLGLGLYIVKQLVDAHEGEIDVASTKEEGTRFKVCLPKQVHQPTRSERQA